MSFVTWIKQTRLGKWLKRQAKKPLIGPIVRRMARAARHAEYQAICWTPENRAHDDRQKSVLAAFEARIGHKSGAPAGGEPAE